MGKDFVFQKPTDSRLAQIVDYYFYLDIPTSKLVQKEEHVIPFPRITFGYFFDHPFQVSNLENGESRESEMIISRVSLNQISVKPLSDRVKILGAHVKPYGLAFFTTENISNLSWLINTEDLFGDKATNFKSKILQCQGTLEMFDQVEAVFLGSLKDRKLDCIIQAVQLIESKKGDIPVSIISEYLGVSDRTLRLHFHMHVGCSPKEYIQLVKFRQAIFQLKISEDSLTSVSYDQNFADQAHFSNKIRQIMGTTPKKLRQQMNDFRFLQF